MYGAILGDIIGSVYEWHNVKTKEFPLFAKHSRFTDDSVMSLAVADGFMAAFADERCSVNGPEDVNDSNMDEVADHIAQSMKLLGRKYPGAGYGGRFKSWIAYGTEPYNSWGNGSAMRTSSAAWIFNDIDTVRRMAALQAAVTHNHPEGMKGAEAVSSAIFLARTGSSKDVIKEYVTKEFGYDLNRTCDEIRPGYEFDVSCQGSVPEAIIAFLDGEDFEDVVRTAVSLGGDSDTIAAMAGSIAEAYYGVPEELKAKCKDFLTKTLFDILERFTEAYQN